MLYSLAGAAVSLLLMVVFRRLDWFGVTGVSILGGGTQHRAAYRGGAGGGKMRVCSTIFRCFWQPERQQGALIGLLGGILVNRLKCLDLTKFVNGSHKSKRMYSDCSYAGILEPKMP